MVTQADVRRIALSLPDAVESKTDFAFSVPVNDKQKGFAWCWKERVVPKKPRSRLSRLASPVPKKPRVPNLSVLGVRVANNVDKDLMIRAEPEKYVTDPHYDGYPAVLVKLAKLRVPELRRMLTESHRCATTPARRKRG